MNQYRNESSEVHSRKIKAGKRTYFFDIKSTRGNDYYITITESKKKPDGSGYEKHKIFLYKEDLLKFADTLQDTVDQMRELMPNFDFEQQNREHSYVEDEA